MTLAQDGSKCHVREAVAKDIEHIAKHMRAADIQEVEAHGRDPTEALVAGYTYSDQLYTFVDSLGNPALIFGTVPLHALGGAVWALGTDGVVRDRVYFLRNSLKWIQELHRNHAVLMNWVDCRNAVHIAWLQRMGFAFGDTARIGVNGEPFVFFKRIRDHV
jgi:hypothetical protein